MWKRILTLPTWVTLVLGGLIVVLVALIFSSINPFNPLNYFSKPTAKIDISRPAVIRQIKGLHRLETSSYAVDKIIEAGTDGNVFQNLLYGDRILLVAHGTVVAGVDLQQLNDDDVAVNGSTLRVTLPASQILSTTLDADQTKVFDRDMGLLSKGDKDLESRARASAAEQIKAAACQDGILQRAADQAIIRIKQMYEMVGFEKVEVTAPAGVCEN
jgi:hypothetical protein